MLTCWIAGCQNVSVGTPQKSLSGEILLPSEKVSFHLFPWRNPDLMQQWLKSIGREDKQPSRTSRICSIHFLENCFEVDSHVNKLKQTVYGRSTKRPLKPNAVPTEFKNRHTPKPDPSLLTSVNEEERRLKAEFLEEIFREVNVKPHDLLANKDSVNSSNGDMDPAENRTNLSPEINDTQHNFDAENVADEESNPDSDRMVQISLPFPYSGTMAIDPSHIETVELNETNTIYTQTQDGIYGIAVSLYVTEEEGGPKVEYLPVFMDLPHGEGEEISNGSGGVEQPRKGVFYVPRSSINSMSRSNPVKELAEADMDDEAEKQEILKTTEEKLLQHAFYGVTQDHPYMFVNKPLNKGVQVTPADLKEKIELPKITQVTKGKKRKKKQKRKAPEISAGT